MKAFYYLCLPTLAGAVSFPFSFPIDRPLPLLHSVNIAEVYGAWWLVVTPICTIVAYAMLMRGTWKMRWSGKATALAWTTLLVVLLLDTIFAVGMIASTT